MTLPGKPLPIRDLEAVTWGLRPRVGEAGSPLGGAGDATAVLPTCVEANAGIRRTTALPVRPVEIRGRAQTNKSLVAYGFRRTSECPRTTLNGTIGCRTGYQTNL